MEVDSLHKTPQHPATDCWPQASIDYGKDKGTDQKASNRLQNDTCIITGVFYALNLTLSINNQMPIPTTTFVEETDPIRTVCLYKAMNLNIETF